MTGSDSGSDSAVVRAARVQDAAAISEILNQVIREGSRSLFARPISAEEERRFIGALSRRGVFHVADMPCTGVVGLQVLEPYAPNMESQRHVATMGTWIRDSYRRRGVATTLTTATFAAARHLGFTKVLTDIRADNTASLAFHQAMGFTVVGVAHRQAYVDGRLVDVCFVEAFL